MTKCTQPTRAIPMENTPIFPSSGSGSEGPASYPKGEHGSSSEPQRATQGSASSSERVPKGGLLVTPLTFVTDLDMVPMKKHIFYPYNPVVYDVKLYQDLPYTKYDSIDEKGNGKIFNVYTQVVTLESGSKRMSVHIVDSDGLLHWIENYVSEDDGFVCLRCADQGVKFITKDATQHAQQHFRGYCDNLNQVEDDDDSSVESDRPKRKGIPKHLIGSIVPQPRLDQYFDNLALSKELYGSTYENVHPDQLPPVSYSDWVLMTQDHQVKPQAFVTFYQPLRTGYYLKSTKRIESNGKLIEKRFIHWIDVSMPIWKEHTFTKNNVTWTWHQETFMHKLDRFRGYSSDKAHTVGQVISTNLVKVGDLKMSELLRILAAPIFIVWFTLLTFGRTLKDFAKIFKLLITGKLTTEYFNRKWTDMKNGFKQHWVALIIGSVMTAIVVAGITALIRWWVTKREKEKLNTDQPHSFSSKQFWKVIKAFVHLIKAWNRSLVHAGIQVIVSEAAIDHLNTVVLTADFSNEFSKLVSDDDQGLLYTTIDAGATKLGDGFDTVKVWFDEPHVLGKKELSEETKDDDFDTDDLEKEFEKNTQDGKSPLNRGMVGRIFDGMGFAKSKHTRMAAFVSIIAVASASVLIGFVWFKNWRAQKNGDFSGYTTSPDAGPKTKKKDKSWNNQIALFKRGAIHLPMPKNAWSERAVNLENKISNDLKIDLKQYRITDQRKENIRAYDGTITELRHTPALIAAEIENYPSVIFGIDGCYWEIPANVFAKQLGKWQQVLLEANIMSSNSAIAMFSIAGKDDLKRFMSVGLATSTNGLSTPMRNHGVTPHVLEKLGEVYESTFDFEIPVSIKNDIIMGPDPLNALEEAYSRFGDQPHSTDDRINKALVHLEFTGKNDTQNRVVPSCTGVGLITKVNPVQVITSKHLIGGHPSAPGDVIKGTLKIWSPHVGLDHQGKPLLGSKKDPLLDTDWHYIDVGWDLVMITSSKPAQFKPVDKFKVSTVTGVVSARAFVFRGNSDDKIDVVPLRLNINDDADKIPAWGKMQPGYSGAPIFDPDGNYIGGWFGLLGGTRCVGRMLKRDLYAGGSTTTGINIHQ